MAEDSDTDSLFSRLMMLNREAFDAGQYNIAYHILMAALHAAQEQRAAQALMTVQRVAEEQLAEIDRRAPAYEHSTASAHTRGHVSIFALLARQAQAHIVMLQR